MGNICTLWNSSVCTLDNIYSIILYSKDYCYVLVDDLAAKVKAEAVKCQHEVQPVVKR